jgi:hypothetical protein
MDKQKGRHARCLALVVDFDIESQSPNFNKLCDAILNTLDLEFAKCCREKDKDIRIALVLPFDVNGCQWIERISEWDTARQKIDKTISSRSQFTPASLSGQLQRLLSSVP